MAVVGEDNACKSTADEARLHIDEKIAHHLECIRHLKSQRNTLAPISKLPPEIMGSILYFASAGPDQTSPVFPCYNFTHVSRSWRSVALNTPNLWQVLPQSVQWAMVMLERSKGTSLIINETLSLSSDSSRTLFLKEVLTEHTSRIGVLDLSNITTLPFALLFENVLQSSLRPYSLTLAARFQREPTFPSGILEAGNLRTLSIERCDGPWYSLSTPALTDLRLYDIPTRPPLTKFLDMLRGLATLNILVMQDSLPLANDRVGLMGPIHLPNLHRLCLHSTSHPKEVTNILPFIIVPPTATLSLTAQKNEITTIQGTLEESALSLSTFFGQLNKVPNYPTAIFVVSREDGYLALRVWNDEKVIAKSELILDLDTSTTSTPAQSVLRRIFPFLPWTNITRLTLNIFPVRMLLEDTFGHISCLRTVMVVGSCTTEFIQALTRNARNHNAGPPTILFPALRSLHISTYSFKEDDLTIADLHECLIERRKQKVGLLKLKLTDCDHLSGEEVESLRQIVSDVEWCSPISDSDSLTLTLTPSDSDFDFDSDSDSDD